MEKTTDSKFTSESYDLHEMSAFAENEVVEGKSGMTFQLAMLRLPFMGEEEISKIDKEEFGLQKGYKGSC